ncbi:type III-B CRISPR module RAMP protein Cmr6 [Pleurocapsales cyanobacterium LEGE 06147]|nr:type III-B CRISPR module RAMP protein Cmr6 [Pleurocapsales cyanobacterium LEGE 06147]
MTFTYPLPSDTRDKFRTNNFRCSNLSLLLDRYIGYSQQWKLKEEDKAELFKKLNKSFNQPLLQKLIKANYCRWQHSIQTFPHCQYFQASPEWRMVVGLGQTSILETSLTLDRVTGIPLIPGSALKGVTAAYALLYELVKNPTDKQKDFLAVFGTQENAGEIIFFDAVPTKIPTLEPDIMNNHYPKYYGENQPPTPYQSPVPVYFLTLGRNSEFAFAVAARKQTPEIEKLVSLAAEWLQQGITTLGVGAKTAAGYGYLTIQK